MKAPSFRTRLLLAMMLLVIGVTGATMLVTGNLLRASYERHFQQSFNFQIDSFLQQREARLAPVREAMADAASDPRLVAAMSENAAQSSTKEPDLDELQRNIDDLYKNGADQLLDVLKIRPREAQTAQAAAFFCFLNTKGELLFPSASVKLPFHLPGLRLITQQLEAIGRSVSRNDAQQMGYLAPPEAPGASRVYELVFTPLVDRVSRQKLGVLAAGFPFLQPELKFSDLSNAAAKTNGTSRAAESSSAAGTGSVLSGIWLGGQFYSPSISPADLPEVTRQIGAVLANDPEKSSVFSTIIHQVPYQVYCQALSTGTAFPPAFQVYLYSLREAQREKQVLGQRILLSGSGALLAALVLSLVISRSMTVPLEELVTGTSKIERGNYQVKVPVRREDELGRLGHAFNEMTERIYAAHLAQEQRILERTQELAERKRAEEALRQSEARLREAQRIAHLGNWRWEIASDKLDWSNEVFSIFGLAPDQFRATHEGFLARVHPEDREKVSQAIRETLENGKTYQIEHRILRPNAETRIVQQRAEVVRDKSGKAVALVGTVQDVTEQKRIEAEFLRAQRLDSIGALAGGMAHDLNNALSPILMGIQLIRRQVQDSEALKMLSVMETNTHRGADMVRQVLTFTRGRDGERELLNLGRLLKEMESIARQTLPKSIAVTTMAPPDLWPVLGNSTQLHQILLNLCINARDAMPQGGEITLAADNVELSAEEAKAIPNAAPGNYVMLLVTDTGTGIAPEALPRIFEPFFTTKEPGKGTGLGLSTIARIVRNHGGFVSVKSEVGVGTSFEIYFPRGETPAASALRPAPDGVKRGSGELVLFIDDDRSVREMVVPTLAEHGYRVLSAANGAEGLILFEQHEREVRLVLTDFAMPVMDGAATIAAIRARRSDVPVILMSGEIDSIKDHPPQGVTALLQKPFRLEQLLSAMANARRSVGASERQSVRA